ncbi:glycosyltransferase family 4 protein [Microcella sp.]|uniref:glycosyltransferase family 4 protein n=1 Tax=Microcella sp. TaxID=1913979 RepID=UPI00391BA447
MTRATDGPRREQVLVLLDATSAHRGDARLDAYLDALTAGLGDELVIVCRRPDLAHFRALAPTAAIEAGTSALRWRGIRMLWRQLALPRMARRHDVDAVHSPQPPIPLLIARPRVVTLHEVAAFTGRGGPLGAARRAGVRVAARLADEVVAPDAHTAHAIEQACGFPAHEVLVVPPHDDPARFAAAHRVAYRAAAAMVPAATGPIALPSARGPDTPAR